MDLKALIFTTFMLLPATYAAAESRELEGNYYLQGVMEMAAQLVLRKDGSFVGEIIYGSADGIAKGTWDVEGNILTLQRDAASQPAKELAFNARGERSLAELEEYLQYSNNYGYDQARENYVLAMRYSHYPEPPAIKPVYVYFEFSQGPSSQLLLSSSDPTDLWLPYDSQRTLKKIGFGTSPSSGPTQWYEVSPASRWFNIGWKKPRNQPLSFGQPEESGLAETQLFLRGDKPATERIQKHYMISLFYDEVINPPTINPVDVYWQFQDGSTEQQVWTDSKQAKLTLPYTAARTLQKIGMRMQGSTADIEWFDITPSGRWLYFGWQALPHHTPGDLAAVFNNLELAIEPDCLALDLGTGKACFRRR